MFLIVLQFEVDFQAYQEIEIRNLNARKLSGYLIQQDRKQQNAPATEITPRKTHLPSISLLHNTRLYKIITECVINIQLLFY